MTWDGPVVFQSTRIDLYEAALRKLQAQCYPCACTRKELEDSALAIDGSRVYPGICRDGLAPGKAPRAIRVRTHAGPITFVDRVQGEVTQSVEREVGDFVLKRADGVYAYQLAVVVDDAAQGVTSVVRGADLLDSTGRQIHLQHLLKVATPSYLHVPVATNAAGEKLSKQTRAPDAVPEDLAAALAFLGMTPPAGIAKNELLEWATGQWNPAHVPRGRTATVDR
jgi:glutamyl-Q tRNA(Asp) synthetase